MKAAIQAILRRYYGPRSESFDPRQLLLFGQHVEQMPLDERQHRGRSRRKLVDPPCKTATTTAGQQLPEHLERIEIEHDLPEQRSLPGLRRRTLPDRRRDQRATRILPGQLQGLEARSSQVCLRQVQRGWLQPEHRRGDKPPQPIDKGLPGPSLLAYVITSKLGDHLPLYRLENIFARQGVHVARSTMCAWMWRRANWSSRWWN